MTKDAFHKFKDAIYKNYIHNEKVLDQIRHLYCLKRKFTTITYTLVVNNRVCYTWRDFKREIQGISPCYRLGLSQPFVNRDNDFIYYVSLIKTCNYHGDNLKHSLAWTLQRAFKAQEGKVRVKKDEVPLRRLIEACSRA